MGSEQSALPPRRPGLRAPPVRRGHTIGHTIAVSNVPEARRAEPASGNNSPGASVCSDSELPYIPYTVDRPIGDSPKTSSRQRPSGKKPPPRRAASAGAGAGGAASGAASGAAGGAAGGRGRVVVVRARTGEQLQEDVQRLQEIPTFLPIMRGALGLPGARDPAASQGLDARAWARLCARLQAHLAACAQPLAADQLAQVARLKESDSEISRLHSAMVEKQRANARHAERLARVREVASQLARCGALLGQTLQDIEELNSLLPAERRLAPFVWAER